MSAQRHERSSGNPDTEQSMIPTPEENSAPPISLEQRLRERRLSSKEREMLDSFFGMSEQLHGIDARTAEPEYGPEVALAAHDFLASTAERRIEKLRETKPDTAHAAVRQLYVMPRAPVDRRIREYYQQFGTNRRSKFGQVLAREEQYLHDKKLPIYAMTYSGGQIDSDGYITPTQKIPRAAYFPEIGLGIKLEETLRKEHHQTAADSVETVLAAYGARFLDLTRDAGRQGIIRVQDRDNHNIYHPNEDDIPEEVRAENYRPR